MTRGSGTLALIGDPVAQSVSPAMHRAAAAELGLDLDYVAIRVRPDDLPEAFARLRHELVGLNVTRPLKEVVIPLLDAVSESARRAGSVNTVRFEGGRAEGDSTDGAGFLAALRRAATDPPRRALLLGTGGAVRAVAAALLEEGTLVSVGGRNEAATRRLVEDLGVEAVPFEPEAIRAAIASSDLLVNGTPLGGWPDVDASPLPPDAPLHPHLVVFDLVYRPRRTALLRAADAARCRTVEGIEMLIEQGARSFEIWTGVRPPDEIMRRAAHAALEEPPERVGAGNREGA